MEKQIIKPMEIYPLPNNRSDFVRCMEKINEIIAYINKNHCEHTDSYQVDSFSGDVYYNVCHNCGILFLAKK